MPVSSTISRLLLAGLLLASIPMLRAQVSADPEAAATNPSDDDELTSQNSWVRQVQSDLIAEKFDDLDRTANDYRQNKTRAAGGAWKLHTFYAALDAPQQTDRDSVEHIAHLEHWMKARPDSITARVALATSLHRWAWVARGNGLAKTVTPEGWRLFGERIKEAQVVLEGSAAMQSMCPQWYSEMMSVSLAQGWDAARARDLFERGVQFEPDYFYLYKQYANYLLPKWYGHSGEAVAFARDAADRLGGVPGDLLYFQIATVVINRSNGNLPIDGMDWPRIQRGEQLLVAQYGNSRRTKNELAFMAYKFRDTAVARRQFALIGDDWGRAVWRDREQFDRARDWARGHTQWPSTVPAGE